MAARWLSRPRKMLRRSKPKTPRRSRAKGLVLRALLLQLVTIRAFCNMLVDRVPEPAFDTRREVLKVRHVELPISLPGRPPGQDAVGRKSPPYPRLQLLYARSCPEAGSTSASGREPEPRSRPNNDGRRKGPPPASSLIQAIDCAPAASRAAALDCAPFPAAEL